jgi:putative ABC transport system substrate-binding protein
MRRREFITLIGGAATAWPLAARAQQRAERMRRVGVLMMYAEGDRAGQIRAMAFQQGLERRGWTAGRNVQIDFRWGTGDVEWARGVTTELLKLAPDVILANSSPAVRAALPASRSVPIVFIAGEPMAQGYVASLARPGGNVTGFSVLEPTVGAKQLGLLKEIAPGVTRVAVMFNPDNAAAALLSNPAIAAARSLGVEGIAAPVQTPAEIEAAMTKLGREPGGGLIFPPDPSLAAHRKLIVELAARERLPAVYSLRLFPAEGGLMSYGVDIPELFRQAAGYVDRIFRGEKPADLPVQQPTRFEMIVNRGTAKALGLIVPNTLLVSADEVIE